MTSDCGVFIGPAFATHLTMRDSDWTKGMPPSSREHLLKNLQNAAPACPAGGREDPWGFKRGPHTDGAICHQYRAPDLAKLTDETLVTAYHCATCGCSMHDHLQIETCPPPQPRQNPQQASKPSRAAGSINPVRATQAAVLPPTTSIASVAVNPSHDGFLDENNDPLAIANRPKPKLKPVVAPPLPPHPGLALAVATTDPADLSNEAFKLEVERLVQQAKVESNVESNNEAFKHEVERLVQQANERDAIVPSGGQQSRASEDDDLERKLMEQLSAVRARKAEKAAVGV